MLDLLKYDENSPTGLVWSDASTHGKRPPGAIAGTLKPNGYYSVCLRPKQRLCHRIVWELHYGEIPDGMSIDHIDRDRGNNRIENLRLSTPYKQQRNRKRKHLPYVSKEGNRFKSNFWLNKDYHYCGCYATEFEAHITALARRLELHWLP